MRELYSKRDQDRFEAESWNHQVEAVEVEEVILKYLVDFVGCKASGLCETRVLTRLVAYILGKKLVLEENKV